MDICENCLALQETESCSKEDAVYWKEKEDGVTAFYLKGYVFLIVSKALFSTFMVYTVLIRRKRKELFLTAVPTLLLLCYIL